MFRDRDHFFIFVVDEDDNSGLKGLSPRVVMSTDNISALVCRHLVFQTEISHKAVA